MNLAIDHMIRRAFCFCLGFLVLGTASLARAQTGAVLAPIVPPAQWMRALADDFLVPSYAELVRAGQQLEQATRALCASPQAAKLTSAQAAWRTAARAWRRLEALPIGPTLERRSLRRVDFWPTRTAQVDEAIARAPATLEALAALGVSAQGLPALEYLLFNNAASVGADAARCRYAVLLARAFADETAALAPAWRAWGDQWGAPEIKPELAQAALTDALNATIGTLEQLRVRKLQKPLRSPGRREPLFDAWRSRATRAHLLATFEGVSVVLLGGRSGIGLLAVLRGAGHHKLAARLDAEARTAGSALQALPADLLAAPAKAVEPALAALARLQATLSAEVAETLRVTIGFNESDGD